MQLNNKKVLVDNNEVAFTRKEYEILKLFLENKNRLFTRDEIGAYMVQRSDSVGQNDRCEYQTFA